MEIVLRDRGLLSQILTRFLGLQDQFSASMVCKVWNAVMHKKMQQLKKWYHIFTRIPELKDKFSASLVCKDSNDVLTLLTRKLTIRSHELLPSLLTRFSLVKQLNLSRCIDQLHDRDLKMASVCLKNLHKLSLGSPDQPQECISNVGFVGFVKNCTVLEDVTLNSIPNLQDSGIEAMTKVCNRLRAIRLVDCRNLSDGALKSLKNCENITELSLKGHFRFTPRGLTKIGENCPTLLKFSLELRPSVDITLAIQSLSIHCRNLEELSLKC